MTSRVFAFLLISTLFSSFALAQQAVSNGIAQAPVENTGTRCKDMMPGGTQDFWDGNQPNLGNLVGHGLTRKKDVQKEIKPIQNCLDDLSGVSATQTTAIKEVDARTQQGVQLVSLKTDEADKHTTDATTRANAALQTANQMTERVSRVERLATGATQYKSGSAQTEIHFRAGQNVLSKAAKEALDQLASSVKNQRNYVIEVRGYAPGQGQAAITNSREMADSVVRYLVLNYQIPMYRIFVLGMGDAAAADAEKSAKRNSTRRVEVSLLRNDAGGEQR